MEDIYFRISFESCMLDVRNFASVLRSIQRLLRNILGFKSKAKMYSGK